MEVGEEEENEGRSGMVDPEVQLGPVEGAEGAAKTGSEAVRGGALAALDGTESSGVGRGDGEGAAPVLASVGCGGGVW